MHLRSCRIVHVLNDELRSDLEDHFFQHTTNISENITDTATSTKDDHSETNDFQFADDAAVITIHESQNQHLLNRFSIWCKWADMIVRVDKCSTFGIKKAVSKSI